MAISFVGSKTFTHAATSAQSCSLTDLLDSAGASATLLEGDIVVINYVLASSGVSSNRSNAAMTPSGYTEFSSNDVFANDTDDTNQLVSYKFMGSTPDTTVSIPASDSTSNGVAVVIHAFRGVDQTTPLDVAATTATGTNTGVANAPSITPTTAGAWILACGAAAVDSGAVFTNPSGMSSTTNHFRSVTITSTAINAVAGTALYTSWSSGAYDPATFGGSTSTSEGSWGATTIALRPAADTVLGGYYSINAWWLGVGLSGPGATTTTVTPDTASLVLTTYALTVNASANVFVTPESASLVLTTYAPTVNVSANVFVTPDVASLVLTTYAPTVNASANVFVTPDVASLVLTTYAPTVNASANVFVTPDAASLVLTSYAPTVTVSGNVSVIPEPASLVLTSYAPTVNASANVSVTPEPASLILTAFAPTVSVSANVSITPEPASLVLTSFAPTVSASQNVYVTPGVCSLILTSFAPGVSVSNLPVIDGTPVDGWVIGSVERVFIVNSISRVFRIGKK